jgi:hypothetical protein
MSPSLRWISIQLGASRDENAWLPGAWARLATRILEKHPDARIVLLGKKEDIPREKAFFSALGERESIGNRVQSLVGRTDFTAWTSVIGRSHWFFAAKTSAVHLAGLLGTRVMQIHPDDFLVDVELTRKSTSGAAALDAYVASGEFQHIDDRDGTVTSYALADKNRQRTDTVLEQYFVTISTTLGTST